MGINFEGGIENIVGTEENAGFQPFSPVPTMFSNASFGIVWERYCPLPHNPKFY